MGKIRVLVLSKSELRHCYHSFSGPNISLDSFLSSVKNRNLKALRVKELKEMIDYLGKYKEIGLSKSGKKISLVTRLEDKLYNDQKIITAQPSMMLTSRPRPIDNNRLNNGNNSSTSLPRKRSLQENVVFKKIQTDPRISGHLSSYNPLRRLVDCVLFQGLNKKDFILTFTGEEVRSFQSERTAFHIYFAKHNLDPQNWHPDTFISVNETRMDFPEANRKLTKERKGSYQLITFSPVVVPSKAIRVENKIRIMFPRWVMTNCVLLFCIVGKKSLVDMVKQVERNTNAVYRQSNCYKKKVNKNTQSFLDDDDILEGEEVVTLNDPLLLIRIRIPAKGKICKHNQVFDLESYLDFSHQNNVWNCPICDKPVTGDELYVDRVLQKVLESVDEDIEKVKLNMDGSFTPLDPLSKLMHDKKINVLDVGLSPKKISHPPLKPHAMVLKKERIKTPVRKVPTPPTRDPLINFFEEVINDDEDLEDDDDDDDDSGSDTDLELISPFTPIPANKEKDINIDFGQNTPSDDSSSLNTIGDLFQRFIAPPSSERETMNRRKSKGTESDPIEID